jgi:hypothetical protein
LINSSVTITRLSGDTYAIGGLATLTQALGTYSFTVNAADIHDQYGSVGSGSLSRSWVMESATVTNAVLAPAGNRGLPLTVTVSLPTQPASVAVANSAFAVYVSTPGPLSLWQNLTPEIASPDSSSAIFPGMSETVYVFTPTGEKRKWTGG